MMRRWLVGALAIGGIGCLAAGIALTLPLLAQEPPAEARPEAPPPVLENKSPAELGWPVYPNAFDFGTVVQADGHGSATYSVRKGTSEEVAAFYRQKLAAEGWRFQRSKPVTMSSGDAPTDPKYSGLRVEWQREHPKQTATLIVLDYPESRSFTAHILLTWTPAASPAKTEAE